MKIIPYSLLTSLGDLDEFNYKYYIESQNLMKWYTDDKDKMTGLLQWQLEDIKNNIKETKKFWAKNRLALDEEKFDALVKNEYESNIRHIQFCKQHEQKMKEIEEWKKDLEKFKAWFEEDGHSKEERLQKIEERFYGLGKKIEKLNVDLSNLDLTKNEIVIH